MIVDDYPMGRSKGGGRFVQGGEGSGRGASMRCSRRLRGDKEEGTGGAVRPAGGQDRRPHRRVTEPGRSQTFVVAILVDVAAVVAAAILLAFAFVRRLEIGEAVVLGNGRRRRRLGSGAIVFCGIPIDWPERIGRAEVTVVIGRSGGGRVGRRHGGRSVL